MKRPLVDDSLVSLEALVSCVPWTELSGDIAGPLRRAVDTARRGCPATERAQAADAAFAQAVLMCVRARVYCRCVNSCKECAHT